METASPRLDVIRNVLKRHICLLQALLPQAADFAVNQQRRGWFGRGGVQCQQGVEYRLWVSTLPLAGRLSPRMPLNSK